MSLAVFLLASCGKESSKEPITLFEKDIVFDAYITTLNKPMSSTTAISTGSRVSSCGPSDYGLFCAGPSFIVTETITIPSTGCQFSVRMELTECTLNGGGSYVTFKFVDWNILNGTSTPCSTYWVYLLGLPSQQFNDEVDLLEAELSELYINQFMTGYVTNNPISGNCQNTTYFHSVFFKPLCTIRCESRTESNSSYYNVVCSTDGCCVDVTHYCIKNGVVEPDGPYSQLLSECTNFIPSPCPRKGQPLSFCKTAVCLN